MSLSYYVVGVVPEDQTWLNMVDVYKACKKAGIEVPDQVRDFFDGQSPDDFGKEVDIQSSEGSDDYRSWFEVKLDEVPSQVKYLRFVMSA